MRRLLLLALLALSAPLAAACGDDETRSAPPPGITAIGTTPQVADLVRNVGGDRVQTRGLLPAGADPHDYEPRPDDAKAVAGADLVVRSGGDLDEWLSETVQNAGADAPVLDLITKVDTLEGGHGHEEEEEHAEEEAGHAEEEEEHAEEEEGEEHEIDPHWWQDPRNAQKAVAAIRDALVAADPDGAATYRANADAYLSELGALDRAIADCMSRVPERRRRLVTTHDALGYYAERYGIEVVGAVIPSLSTKGQPSAGETAELVRTIRREGVTTVFAESSINAKVERAIAEEAGARLGKPLFADSLGRPGTEGDTYLESLAVNTRALVDGFTNGEAACELPV